eukprot:scaffold4851_cov428-Prasinococcus_capsulatus_cf.AAC.3
MVKVELYLRRRASDLARGPCADMHSFIPSFEGSCAPRLQWSTHPAQQCLSSVRDHAGMYRTGGLSLAPPPSY